MAVMEKELPIGLTDRISRLPKRRLALLFLLPVLAVLLVYLASLGFLFQYSFRTFVPGSLQIGGFTWANYWKILDPLYLGYLMDTFRLSAYTTIFTLILGYPVAYALARSQSRPFSSIVLILTVVPFFTGVIVRTYSWMLMLGSSGFLNALLLRLGLISEPIEMMFTETAVIIGLVQYSLPVMILLLAAAISHIDVAYEKSAQSLGANPLQTFLRVTLPLSLPGIISGSIVIFAWTLSAFPTPQMLGGGKVKMIAISIYEQAIETANYPFGAALALFMLVLTLLVMGGLQWALNRPGRGNGHG